MIVNSILTSFGNDDTNACFKLEYPLSSKYVLSIFLKWISMIYLSHDMHFIERVVTINFHVFDLYLYR